MKFRLSLGQIFVLKAEDAMTNLFKVEKYKYIYYVIMETKEVREGHIKYLVIYVNA